MLDRERGNDRQRRGHVSSVWRVIRTVFDVLLTAAIGATLLLGALYLKDRLSPQVSALSPEDTQPPDDGSGTPSAPEGPDKTDPSPEQNPGEEQKTDKEPPQEQKPDEQEPAEQNPQEGQDPTANQLPAEDETKPEDPDSSEKQEQTPAQEQTPYTPPEEIDTSGTTVYEFGKAVPESERVDDTFFDNAVFLGDSRTEGLQLFSGLHNGDFYWKRGMNVFRAVDENRKYFTVNGKEVSLVGTLAEKSYSAVYLMLGINELGYTPKEYERGLGILLDSIIAAQPNAVIYLQTMPPINDEKAKEYGNEWERTEYVDNFNEVIVRLAKEKRVALLDTASVYRGPDGQLPSELTADGVHFTSKGYGRWADYLRTHVLDPEAYFSARNQGSEDE